MTTEISSYEDFFRITFGNEPFAYQKELADENIDFPSLLNAPTGAGKTNAVLGAWLWRRLYKPESVGRRLIYCLPMRTLVEQTHAVAKTVLENLIGVKIKIKDGELKEITSDNFSVHILYGGDVSDDWDIFPERQQIIIGTQDLLLSRALNRGYAMNRFRWAFHFGLFNNDCLWVFDEVQLFGDGLATTAQLAAFRDNKEKFGMFGKSNSLWMSATLDKDWLKTVDFSEKVDGLSRLELSEQDRENPELKKRLNAVKVLQKADVDCRLPKGLAEFVFKKHEHGTQTLIVVNTVQRAQEVFAELEKLYPEPEKQAKKPAEFPSLETQWEKPEIKLLHSRFRPAERNEWQEIFKPKNDEKVVDRIIVATQVIEAGVDISSKLLITDIAPFPSLVQRFGRVNRTGEYDSSEIYWVDVPLKDKDKDKDYAEQEFEQIDEKKLADLLKPYELESLKRAKAILEKTDSASPNDLTEILKKPENREKFTPNHVLRQRDLIDLFDTTADLSGFDLDVSRFVRGGEERDVSVYWRENVEETIKPVKGTKKEKKELAKMFAPHRDELCSVPIYDAKTFIDKKKAWTFDTLSGEWREIKKDNLRTGIIILLDAESGGYDKIGWNPKSKAVIPVAPSDAKSKAETENNAEATDDDNQTYETKVGKKFLHYTQTLTAHSLEVRQAAVDILEELKLPELEEFRERIISAAYHHDLGKAHEYFQTTLHKAVYGKENPTEPFTPLLAKSAKYGKHGKERNNFRHELASALALIERNRNSPDGKKHDDLEIYLVAAHHGKVRLSIRALPDENKPKDKDGKLQPERKFARGIWDDDKLPTIDLGDGTEFPAQTLNLNALSLGKTDGESSWLERMINLREELGVFRLAYLEAIVRAADVQASACPKDTLPETDTTANEQNPLEVD